MILERLDLPIVQAPMAGGPSTPALAAAVSEAGGLGFLGAGYLTVQRLREDIAATRALTGRPFGVNLFVGGGAPADPALVEAYAARLAEEAERTGVALARRASTTTRSARRSTRWSRSACRSCRSRSGSRRARPPRACGPRARSCG